MGDARTVRTYELTVNGSMLIFKPAPGCSIQILEGRGRCDECAEDIAGAHWDSVRRTVTCETCRTTYLTRCHAAPAG